MQDAVAKAEADLQTARVAWSEEKAQLVSASGQTAAALQAELSSVQNDLAGATASVSSLQQQRTMLTDQLAEVKQELATKAGAAEASSNRAAELAEALKSAERRAEELEQATRTAAEEHSTAVAALREELADKGVSLEGTIAYCSKGCAHGDVSCNTNKHVHVY
jgi:chromosome segregation ATPase